MKKKSWAVVPLIIFGVTFSKPAVADFANSPIHHTFNAQLLQPNEMQISVFGNGKIGLANSLEIGVQGSVLLLGLIPNIAIKHKMFDLENTHTSFSSHFFTVLPNVAGTTSMGGIYGVTSTYDITALDFLNIGIFDFFTTASSSKTNDRSSIHILTTVIGFDKYLTNNWAFSSVVTVPTFSWVNLATEEIDISGTLGVSGTGGALFPSLAFLTMIYSSVKTNYEFGLVAIDGRVAPYGNIFWRFK